MKLVRLRPKAKHDLRREVAYYRDEASENVAQRLRNQAEQSLLLLAQNPGVGSPVLGRELGIDNLRTWALTGFPLTWLYFDRSSHLDVIRLLGQRQDISAILLAEQQKSPE